MKDFTNPNDFVLDQKDNDHNEKGAKRKLLEDPTEEDVARARESKSNSFYYPQSIYSANSNTNKGFYAPAAILVFLAFMFCAASGFYGRTDKSLRFFMTHPVFDYFSPANLSWFFLSEHF